MGACASAAATQARVVGEKILAALSRPYTLGGRERHCSASIGITLFSDHLCTVDELLKRADQAMYQAKAAGRDALRFFDAAAQDDLRERSFIEADLRVALAQGQGEGEGEALAQAVPLPEAAPLREPAGEPEAPRRRRRRAGGPRPACG